MTFQQITFWGDFFLVFVLKMVSLGPILFSRGISHIAYHRVVCFKGVLVVYESSNKVKACVILNLQELQVMKSAYTKSKL